MNQINVLPSGNKCEYMGIIGDVVKGDAELLLQISKLINGGTFVEVGSSTCFASLVISEDNKNDLTAWTHCNLTPEKRESLILSIFKNPNLDQKININMGHSIDYYKKIIKHGLESPINIVNGDYVKTIEIHEDDSIDAIYLDINPDELDIVDIAWRKLKNSGNMLIHNCMPNSPLIKKIETIAPKTSRLMLCEGTWYMCFLKKKTYINYN